jgi:cyclophilin family peptidyl-prolyl cis-trans isomerase
MLRHLAEIIHGKGMVDNRLNRATCINNRGQARQMRLLRITFDNLSLLKRIQSQKPFYSRKKQLDEYHRMEQAMRHLSYYPLYWQINKESLWGPFEAKAKANALYRPRPRVFITLGNSNEFYGKILIELFASECPMTAENFRGLCTGEYGLSYKCSTIHKVIQDILWQGGELNLNSQGVAGNKSIYGDTFPDENFKIKHDKAGIVTMANWGPNTNGSQFIITAKKLSILDGCNVAFGQVIAGFHVLSQLCSKLTPAGKPKKKFFIIDCGELDPDADFDEYHDGCEDSETEQENTVSEPPTLVTETDEEDTYADNQDTASIR